MILGTTLQSYTEWQETCLLVRRISWRQKMFRNFLLPLVILTAIPLAIAQQAKDPLLRHRLSHSDKRLKTIRNNVGQVPPARSKTTGVNAELSKIERESLKSQAPPAHRNPHSSVMPNRTHAASANPPINFAYRSANAKNVTPSAGGSTGGSKVGLRPVR